MAGGTFYSENKTRPGAYINFKKDGSDIDLNSIRGTVAVALELNWGEEDSLINVTANDLLSGKALAKVGFMASDDEAKILNLILANASIAKIYRLNRGGNRASRVINETLTVTAKNSGTFGNKIAILISQSGTVFEVNTYANGYLVDTQRAATIADLVENDYVTFAGTGALTSMQESVLLTGGTNGTVAATTAYNAFFELLRNSRWQVLAICNNAETINPLVPAFIREMRNDEGKYVQAVIANGDVSTFNYEGIINNVNGVVINGVTISAVEFTAYVAGLTAGASITESNTGKVIEGATQIVGQLSNEDIIAGLKVGKFILSSNQDGAIKVEKDINSLHDYSGDLDYNFTKNRVIRVLDEIGTGIESIWENTFLGKVSNNEDGRDMFKATIITYLQELQNRGAIQNFGGAEDVDVAIGESIDSVVATIRVRPVDSMEFLYLTVNVAE